MLLCPGSLQADFLQIPPRHRRVKGKEASLLLDTATLAHSRVRAQLCYCRWLVLPRATRESQGQGESKAIEALALGTKQSRQMPYLMPYLKNECKKKSMMSKISKY